MSEPAGRKTPAWGSNSSDDAVGLAQAESAGDQNLAVVRQQESKVTRARRRHLAGRPEFPGIGAIEKGRLQVAIHSQSPCDQDAAVIQRGRGMPRARSGKQGRIPYAAIRHHQVHTAEQGLPVPTARDQHAAIPKQGGSMQRPRCRQAPGQRTYAIAGWVEPLQHVGRALGGLSSRQQHLPVRKQCGRMVPALGALLDGGPRIERGVEPFRRQARTVSLAAGRQYPSVGERRARMPGAGAKHIRRRQERPVLLINLHAPKCPGRARSPATRIRPSGSAAAQAPWRATWSGPVADQ